MWARHTLALATAGLIGGAISTASAQSTIVVAPSALPPPQVETVPPPPTTTSYWQPGHWSWNGVSWTWVDGTFQSPPNPIATWVPGQWILSPSAGACIATHDGDHVAGAGAGPAAAADGTRPAAADWGWSRHMAAGSLALDRCVMGLG